MRRRLLLLGALTCAVAIAVLLRAAATDFEPVLAGERVEPGISPITELALQDCSIAPESAPGLATPEAAQLFLFTPADAIEVSVSPNADERRISFSPEVDLGPPKSPVDLFRDTIRPPPATHIF